MPSNTAFALRPIPAGHDAAMAYDDLTGGLAEFNESDFPRLQKLPFVDSRGLTASVQNLRALGVAVDDQHPILRGLRAAIVTNHSLYMLYGAHIALRNAEAAREAALAASETAAMAVAQQWHLIAQAAASAALVYSAFKVGEKFGSGEWHLPSVDLSNGVERRRAIRALEDINR